MKNVLSLFVLFAFAIPLYAQPPAYSIRVKNNTSCTVYYVFKNGPAIAPCSPSMPCSVQSLAAGASVVHTSASLYGTGTIYEVFNYAVILKGSPACTSSGYLIGEPCTGQPNSVAVSYFNTTCTSICSTGIAKWYSAPVPMGEALLEFN